MSAKCCNNDCPCPGLTHDPDGQGGPWERMYGGRCCGCTLIDYEENIWKCKQLDKDPITGRPANPNSDPPCGCKCNLADKNPPCDPDSDFPDFRAEACACICQKVLDKQLTGIDPCWTTPDGKGSIKYTAKPCQCKCVDQGTGTAICKSLNPANPHFDRKSDTDCSCYCKFTEADCAKFKFMPHLNPEKCECYCKYRPYGTPPEQLVSPPREACPQDKPSVKSEDCSCYCAVDPNTCPPDKPDFQTTKCRCRCPLTDFVFKNPDTSDCDKYTSGRAPDYDGSRCRCYCKVIEDGCPAGLVPDPNGDCACVCPVGMEDCGGRCYDLCAADEVRRPAPDCTCYANSLLSNLLLP